MEIFAPENLPGVGMGDLSSIAAVCGLLGLAVTSGMLIAEGMVGTIVYVLSAMVVLQQKEDFGGSVVVAGVVLGVLVVAAAVRWRLEARAGAEASTIVGAAADDPATKAARARIASRERWARRVAIAAVTLAGAAIGFAWAEWNEAPLRLDDLEGGFGLVLGVVGASIGGDAAWRFMRGATRAGGSVMIVGCVVVIAAWALNAVSFYVPFVGAAVLILALVFVARLRRRQQQTYEGLRILN